MKDHKNLDVDADDINYGYKIRNPKIVQYPEQTDGCKEGSDFLDPNHSHFIMGRVKKQSTPGSRMLTCYDIHAAGR